MTIRAISRAAQKCGSSILTGHYRFPAGIRRDRRVQCNRTRRR